MLAIGGLGDGARLQPPPPAGSSYETRRRHHADWTGRCRRWRTGALARYLLDYHAGHHPEPHHQVYVTFAVNLTGSLLLGLLIGAHPDGRVRIVLGGVGFLASFTTFSTLVAQVYHATEQAHYTTAVLLPVASVISDRALAGRGRAVGTWQCNFSPLVAWCRVTITTGSPGRHSEPARATRSRTLGSHERLVFCSRGCSSGPRSGHSRSSRACTSSHRDLGELQ